MANVLRSLQNVRYFTINLLAKYSEILRITNNLLFGENLLKATEGKEENPPNTFNKSFENQGGKSS
jgi:hypothetical protein